MMSISRCRFSHVKVLYLFAYYYSSAITRYLVSFLQVRPDHARHVVAL